MNTEYFFVNSKNETKINDNISTLSYTVYHGKSGFITQWENTPHTVESYKDFVYQWRLVYKELSKAIRELKNARKSSYFESKKMPNLGWFDQSYLQSKLHMLRCIAKDLMALRMDRKEKFKALPKE